MVRWLALLLIFFSGSTFADGEEIKFPTSINGIEGDPWVTMGRSPYTGTMEEACALLPLTTAECGIFLQSYRGGQCSRLEVPNGVVLDSLLFGERGVKTHILVKLKDPPSRWADVCPIIMTSGYSLYVGRFDGCGNPFKIVAAPDAILPPEPFIYEGEGGGFTTCP